MVVTVDGGGEIGIMTVIIVGDDGVGVDDDGEWW